MQSPSPTERPRARVGDDALTDALLAFEDPRRSLAAVAAAIDEKHVPLRTAVVTMRARAVTRRGRTATWFFPGVERGELRAAARRATAALRYLVGDASTLAAEDDAVRIATYVTLPLVDPEGVMGVVQLGCRRAPRAVDVAFFDAFARRLAGVVRRGERRRRAARAARRRAESVVAAQAARLSRQTATVEALDRALEDRSLLRDVGACLVEGLVGAEGVLDAALEGAVRLVGARTLVGGCAIDVLEGETTRRFAHAPTFTAARLDAAMDRVVPGVMLGDAAVFTFASDEAPPLAADVDLAAMVRRSAASARVELDATWLASLPLRDRGEPVGALTVFSAGSPREALPRGLLAAIAARVAAAMASARSYAEARSALDRRDHVLAMVSHELRSPLGAVLLNAHRLLHALPERDRRSAGRGELDAIERSARRAARLLDDLVDATALDAGTIRLALAQRDVAALVREAVATFEHAAAEKGITLSAVVPQATIAACVDGDRVVQIVSNLVSNAIKFTPAGGCVVVSAAALGDVVQIAVTDAGVGIAEADLPRLFTRFWRARAAYDTPGLGLGLSIARDLARAHGGDIEATSELGRGSTFRVVLPRG